MELAEKIRQLRKQAGLTQKELAKKIGVSTTMIVHFENGHKAPTIKRLRQISDAIGCQYNELTSLVSGKNYRQEKTIESLLIDLVRDLPEATKRKILRVILNV